MEQIETCTIALKNGRGTNTINNVSDVLSGLYRMVVVRLKNYAILVWRLGQEIACGTAMFLLEFTATVLMFVVSSDITQCPVLTTAQSALHVIPCHILNWFFISVKISATR